MPTEIIYKTIHQYSKLPVSESDMGKLMEIAKDCCKVKNYVYARYGGIGGLGKIYPGYTVQNEMTKSGFRAELGLPSVYFYLAIFEALSDIKGQWSRTKAKVLKLVGRNETFTVEEKHYLRFLLKVNNAFEAALHQMPPALPEKIKNQYDELAEAVDADRLNRYLCRQVRTHHARSQADVNDGFSISERAYRYGVCGKEHGIYISTKENRKRIFVALTDKNQYKCQLHVRLKPKEASIEIDVPIGVAAQGCEDYTNLVGIAMGFFSMLTTDGGHVYGEELGAYQTEYAGWIRGQQVSYRKNCSANPGRKKYEAKKRRYEERLHSYINHELNRFFQAEKPRTVYMVRLPYGQKGGINRKINHHISLWKRGYIRERIAIKCREQSVEFIEVFGQDISRECSNCGAIGRREKGIFICDACGYQMKEKINTARNTLKRGQAGMVVHSDICS